MIVLGSEENQSKPEESLPRGLLGFLNKWTLCLFLLWATFLLLH